jgi:5-methylcytosine-specific restriction endonuclease McrBC regulatory subunit McrC
MLGTQKKEMDLIEVFIICFIKTIDMVVGLNAGNTEEAT